MTETLTVMLVDDHDLFRAGLRQLLEKEGIRVACDCPSGKRALDLTRKYKPDVVLLDFAMESDVGIDLAARLVELFPSIPIIVLSLSDAATQIYGAVRAGVRGYMFKGTPTPELVAGIRAVAAGEACLAYGAASTLMKIVHTGDIPRVLDTELSEREIEVIRQMAAGYDNKRIAAEMNISAKTVKNHVATIFTKLGMNNRVQAAVWAVRSGLA